MIISFISGWLIAILLLIIFCSYFLSFYLLGKTQRWVWFFVGVLIQPFIVSVCIKAIIKLSEWWVI